MSIGLTISSIKDYVDSSDLVISNGIRVFIKLKQGHRYISSPSITYSELLTKAKTEDELNGQLILEFGKDYKFIIIGLEVHRYYKNTIVLTAEAAPKRLYISE